MAVLALCVSAAGAEALAFATGSASNRVQNESHETDSKTPKMAVAPTCEAAGKKNIDISCEYKAVPRSGSKKAGQPRVVLNRAAISFQPDQESHMSVALTFTNAGSQQVSDARTVYIAIDDDAGINHVRRMLLEVDFRKLAPGQQLTFSERLLIPAFRPGLYRIELWIPDPDPSLKFNPAHNFLLNSVGVANPETGLNRLATFTVDR